jgi:hypothetical protein
MMFLATEKMKMMNGLCDLKIAVKLPLTVPFFIFLIGWVGGRLARVIQRPQSALILRLKWPRWGCDASAGWA